MDALYSDKLDYHFELAPFEKQRELLESTADLPYFAIFWQQGTGKSKIAIDNACYLYEKGKVDAMLIVAPNDVHRNWIEDEIPKHVPQRLRVKIKTHFYQSVKSGTQWHQRECQLVLYHKGFSIVAISYDAFMTQKGKRFVWSFLKRRRCYYIADESSDIKSPGAKRTKSVVASGRYAPYKRILDGTPTGGVPFEMYSQIRFLDENFWKHHELDNYSEFKAYFGIWRKGVNRKTGKEFEFVTGYRRLEMLKEMVRPISSRVLKKEVVDLPPKLYSKRHFELTPEQRRIYEELKQEYKTYLHSGELVTAPLAIVRLMRLQQVTCGYIPPDNPHAEPEVLIPGGNPRLDLLGRLCARTPGKGIIWARFHMDVDLIMKLLGKSAVRYDGTMNPDSRAESKYRFKTSSSVQWLVANQAAMARGHTITEATYQYYYSNTFSLRQREQSEDRAHRTGQTETVEIIDIIAPGTVDHHIVRSLRNKKDVAATITGDELERWL